MESQEISCKVTEPTEWVSFLVAVEKPNGKLRVCLDPKDLNRAIHRHHYPMKTLEDTLPYLSKALRQWRSGLERWPRKRKVRCSNPSHDRPHS